MDAARGPAGGEARGLPGRQPGAWLLRQTPLLILLLGYAWLGVPAVVLTRPWQIPDEPAHLNQVRQRLEGQAPVIEAGDYPFEIVRRVSQTEGDTGLRSEELASIQYEDHQPPLYYRLGALVLRLTEGARSDPAAEPAAGSVDATSAGPAGSRADDSTPWGYELQLLRFLSLLLGACTLLLFWWVAGLLRPGDWTLRVAVSAFAAFLPMQLHLNSGVNNDALAFAVCAAALGLALRRLGPDGRAPATWGGALVAGLWMGVAALSKLSALLPTVLLLLGAELLARWGRREGLVQGGGPAALSPAMPSPIPTSSPTPDRIATPSGSSASTQPPLLAWLVLAVGFSLLLAAPWLRHNIVHYGWADPLALKAHDLATACPPGAPADCQPRTDAWIAEHGWMDLLGRGLSFTFKSFWGVFGWMAVFLGRLKGIPIYGALVLSTALAAAGLLWRLGRGWLGRGGWLRRAQAALLGLHLAATFGGFVWYNLSFVQHQGRYLLPALLPLALAYCAGLRALVQDLAAGLGAGRATAQPLGRAALVAHAAALALLAWISVTRYVIPALGWP